MKNKTFKCVECKGEFFFTESIKKYNLRCDGFNCDRCLEKVEEHRADNHDWQADC